eukprot:GAFH01005428.1.p2 GENE.GAFH01005428.1~~GAFH01005428.1.p2  ORF type:complete len:99 (-),score=12.07 GAFH01005428.1:338-604(-)
MNPAPQDAREESSVDPGVIQTELRTLVDGWICGGYRRGWSDNIVEWLLGDNGFSVVGGFSLEFNFDCHSAFVAGGWSKRLAVNRKIRY